MKRGNNDPGREGKGGVANDWMLTFNDMLTLLFTFFVLLLAFSALPADYVVQAAKSFRETKTGGLAPEGGVMRIFQPFVTPVKDADIEAEKARNDRRREMEKALRLKAGLLKVLEGSPGAIIADWPLGMGLQFAPADLFDPSGHMVRQGRELLVRLREAIKQEEGFVRVEAYAGAFAARGSENGGDNLAAIRAAAIAAAMTADGGLEAERVAASGHDTGGDPPTDGKGAIRIFVSARHI